MYIGRLLRTAFAETTRVWNFGRTWLTVLAPAGAIVYRRWTTGQYSDTRGTLLSAFVGWVVAYVGTVLVNLVRGVALLDRSLRQELQGKLVDIANLQRAVADAKRLSAAPSLIFQGWGEIPADHPEAIGGISVVQNGFYLKNVGGDAYSVCVERFEVEPSVWASSKLIPHIGAQETKFAFVWLEGYPPGPINVEKWDLLEAMKKAADAKPHGIYRPNYIVTVSVIYADSPDSDSQWYRTSTVMSYIPSQFLLHFGSPTRKMISPL